MARISITVIGTSPLIQHNIRLANADDEFARQIAEITKKRTKTEEDRKTIARLEWFGGLYTAPGIPGPVTPTANIRKCIVNGAKIKKQGALVGRALFFTSLAVPVDYEGPRDLDKLFCLEQFRDYCSVGIQQARTMRCRPKFMEWSITATAELLDDVMDFDDLQRVVELAGLVEGLGDNRINGFGRFIGEVKRT